MKKARVIVILILALSVFISCAPSSLNQIQTKNELVVGTAGNMPPLNMTTKDGEIIGFEMDLARRMADSMGVELRFEKMAFAELLPALEKGTVDMVISGMTITPNRNVKVAFVGPYFISGKAFLTKIETIAAAKDPASVNSPNTSYAALKGSTSQAFVESVLPLSRLVTTQDYDEAVDLVLNGEVEAMVADYPICIVSLFRYPDQGLLSLITPFTYEPLGIAVPGGDAHLINWVENFLSVMKGSGQLDELKERWFFDGAWLNRLPQR
ncbi:MAG: transporter substrate-binding domain-containing protein [Desulfobacterales bacterium]|nr:transporter substrate-binding domain-containing protein [Desulfobacterales bacterium]